MLVRHKFLTPFRCKFCFGVLYPYFVRVDPEFLLSRVTDLWQYSGDFFQYSSASGQHSETRLIIMDVIELTCDFFCDGCCYNLRNANYDHVGEL